MIKNDRYYISNDIRFIQGYGNIVPNTSAATHMKHAEAKMYINVHPDHVMINIGGNSKKNKNFVVSTPQKFIGKSGTVVCTIKDAMEFKTAEDAFEYLDGHEDVKKLLKNPYVITDAYKKIQRPTLEPQPKNINPITNRIKFSNETRKTVLRIHHGICPICGMPVTEDEATIDHIIPLSRGGTNDLNNLRPTHEKCNLLKHNLLDEELFDSITNITCNSIYKSPASDMSMKLIRSFVRGTIAQYMTCQKKIDIK